MHPICFNVSCFVLRNIVSLANRKYDNYVLLCYGNIFPIRRKKPERKQSRDRCVKIIATNASIDIASYDSKRPGREA